MSQTFNGTESLYSSLGGDPDLGEIVALFVDEMPERVALLLGALQAGDWETLRRTAHQLKGAAGSYGFAPITPCAGALESAMRNHAPEDAIREAVESLIDMCSRVRAGAPR